MSIANKVPTPIVDKNGKQTTVHKNPMQDIKNRIKNVPTAPVITSPAPEPTEDIDRVSLPVQEYTITRENVAKFEHVIEKANNRLARGGVEERFTYEFTSEVKKNEDGSHREVINAILNKPVISNGDWTFTATHEFTPAGDVISYWSESGDFESPSDSHCDQCGKNRRRERVYTVSNEQGETKQIGSNCLELFMGMRPEGLWSLNDTKIEDELSDLESASLGGTSGLTYPIRDIIGIALQQTDGGANYVSRIAGTKSNPATAEVVSLAMSGERQPFDEASVSSVIDFIRSSPSDGSDYMDNLKAIFGSEDGENGVFVKQRHLGIAASAVSAWYRDSHKPDRRKPDRIPANPEYIGQPKERIKTPTKFTVDRRFSYENDYGTVDGYVLRDDQNHILLWKSQSGSPPDVWEGGTVELSAFTVKEHKVDSYTGDNQTVIQRPAVSGVEHLGKAPQWKVSEVAYDAIRQLPEDQREAMHKEFEEAEDLDQMKAFATRLSGIGFA